MPPNGLTTRRSKAIGVDLGANRPLNAINTPAAHSQPNAPSAPLNATGVYDPFGVVSDLRFQRKQTG
jgi:hypothetical protein